MRDILHYILSIAFFTIFVDVSFSQIVGCTDSNAINYDINATENDGFCDYEYTEHSLQLVAELENRLKETSNLISYKNMLWTTNDSGNTPKLYALDTLTGEIIFSFYIKDVVNKDWEALAQSEEAIFIGDIGNNLGNRTDLKIHQILKSDIEQGGDTLETQQISFYYPEQTDFSAQNYSTPWDAEAMYYFNDSLYIFTKNWAEKTTTLYAIPNQVGTHAATKKETFDVDGLISDASYNEENQAIILLGYKFEGLTAEVFCWLLWNYSVNNVFSGNKRRIELGSVFDLGQTEGVTWHGKNKGFISSEEIKNGTLEIEPNLYRFDFEEYLSPESLSYLEKDNTRVKIVNNPAENTIYLEVSTPQEVVIITENSKEVYRNKLIKGVNSIECSSWAKGTYFVVFGNKTSKKIIIR